MLSPRRTLTAAATPCRARHDTPAGGEKSAAWSPVEIQRVLGYVQGCLFPKRERCCLVARADPLTKRENVCLVACGDPPSARIRTCTDASSGIERNAGWSPMLIQGRKGENRCLVACGDPTSAWIRASMLVPETRAMLPGRPWRSSVISLHRGCVFPAPWGSSVCVLTHEKALGVRHGHPGCVLKIQHFRGPPAQSHPPRLLTLKSHPKGGTDPETSPSRS